MKTNILAIDPGLSGTGYSFHADHEAMPILAGSIYAPSTVTEWLDKANYIRARLVDTILVTCITAKERLAVVIEQPSVMSSSEKGVASAGKGDVIKLSMFVGMLAATLIDNGVDSVEFVPVIVWKGQTSKYVVNKRVERITGPLPYKAHALDAIGIALWKMGYLK